MGGCEARGLTGTQLSRYLILDLLGSGGMGHVYRARDERLQRDVAIKVLCHPSDGASAPHQRELAAEARALSRLSHPHVAAIYDYLTDGGRDFIVMELVEGVTLREILAAGPLAFPDVKRLGQHMLSGLAAAHAGQVLHCDIKPSNLKVTPSGNLKILDFGLAQLLPCSAAVEIPTHTPPEFAAAGTMPYMAPERLRGECGDERSDIFSAGAVLYEMATGQPAFPQRTFATLIGAILHHQPPAPSTVNPQVSRQFDRVVAKAMAKRPRDRYQSVAELAQALGRISDVRPAALGRISDVRAAAAGPRPVARRPMRPAWTESSALNEREA